MPATLEALAGHIRTLFEQAAEIWLSGGWAMIAIAATALVMFGLGMKIWLQLRDTGFAAVPEETWRRWIHHPSEREGPIGERIEFVTGARSLEDSALFFDELRTTETAPFVRDLRVMKVCVGAAPLLGLLGTVTGMLTTFGALASGPGGEKTMAMVAQGISEALITTETGLVVALPGLFFQYQLARRFEAYKAFLAHLETVSTQTLFKQLQASRARRIDRLARERIAQVLERHLAPTA